MTFDTQKVGTAASVGVLILLIAAITTPFLAFSVTGPDLIDFIRQVLPSLDDISDEDLYLIAETVFEARLEDYEEVTTYSILGGIRELWRTGSYLPAVIIVVFSVLFPIAKTALGAYNLYKPFAPRLNVLAYEFHRLSMIDIFVGAVIVFVISNSTGYSVSVRIGFYVFCAYFFAHYALSNIIHRYGWNKG